MADTDPREGSGSSAADHGGDTRPDEESIGNQTDTETPPELGGVSDPTKHNVVRGDDDEGYEVPLSERDPTEREVYSLLMGERPSVAAIGRESDFEVIRRYWIQQPHVYVAILDHEVADDYLYYVVTPSLRADEETLYQKLYTELRNLLFRIETEDGESPEDVIERHARRKMKKLGTDLTPASKDRVLYFLKRNIVRYDRLDPLLEDPELERVTVNGSGADNPVFVQHQDFGNIETSIVLQEERLPNLIRKIGQRAGQDVSRANPIQRASLPGGSDVQLFLEDVSPDGSALTIQKQSDEPFTPIDLIEQETFSPEQLAYLWSLVESGESGLVIGGLSAGKGDVLNVLGMFVPPRERVVTVEGSPELQLAQQNHIQTTTRRTFGNSDSDEVGRGELIESALDNKPEYLFVDEVGSGAAKPLFRGMSLTGNAIYTTITADSVTDAAQKLEHPPTEVPAHRLQELGFGVVQQEQSRAGERVRRNVEIVEFGASRGEGIDVTTIWSRDRRSGGVVEHLDKSSYIGERIDGQQVPREELERRAAVLDALISRSISGFSHVTTVLRAYMVAPEVVLEQVEQESFDFDVLEDIVGKNR
ncbi:type II/IV secretion system ATPase subunit [Halorubrum pallidum]|uniref:Type II/IV secretion system ATPase subunit n=1 Tax=Halorubrum pallidum TaxID=1526114 RepID=A0ABD5SYH8_9EURY